MEMPAIGGMAQASPWGAAIGGAVQLGAKALDDKTNQTQTTGFESTFDGSGWNVNAGGGRQTAAYEKVGDSTGFNLGALLQQNPMVLIAICALAFVYLKKKM